MRISCHRSILWNTWRQVQYQEDSAIRPLNDTSVVSPSGKFRIHFDTTNVNGNQPFLYDANGQRIPNSTRAYVDSVAQVCDHVYHVEVDSFGYPPPPSDSGVGGGNEYDIYISPNPYYLGPVRLWRNRLGSVSTFGKSCRKPNLCSVDDYTERIPVNLYERNPCGGGYNRA